MHEIFPKSALVKAGYGRAEINAIANFAFVGPSSASRLSGAEPVDYLAELTESARRSQWIPEDPSLWRVDRYREFLDARRELLASAATALMDDLLAGRMPWNREIDPVVVVDPTPVSDPRHEQLALLVDELSELGFATPDRDAEIADQETGRVLAVAELFWDRGLQPGKGGPVVLELDPDEADVPRLAELGYTVFTTVDALRGYVQRLGEEAAGVTGLQPEPAPDLEPALEVPDDGAFDHAVFATIEACRADLSYNPQYFREMVLQHGAVGAVRRLLASTTPSDGFVRLWEAGRLDLTVEALAVDPRFAALFGEKERVVAQDRLDRSRQGVGQPA